MSDLMQSIEDGKNQVELEQLAQKLFPGRVSIQSRTWICDCCGKQHGEISIIIKERKNV